jgi:hypothetical protein
MTAVIHSGHMHPRESTVNVTINGGSYEMAIQKAQAIAGKKALVRVRTRNRRIILMPERMTTKKGNRDFGRERIRPVVSGHIVRRTFVFGEPV